MSEKAGFGGAQCTWLQVVATDEEDSVRNTYTTASMKVNNPKGPSHRSPLPIFRWPWSNTKVVWWCIMM